MIVKQERFLDIEMQENRTDLKYGEEEEFASFSQVRQNASSLIRWDTGSRCSITDSHSVLNAKLRLRKVVFLHTTLGS